MTERLTDKGVVVTGAASGNGRAIAQRFATEGANVTIADIQTEPREDGQPTHDLIENNGGNAQFVETDVTSKEDVQNAITATVEEYGSLDVMVNNAGILPKMHSVTDYDDGDYDRVLDINLRGVFYGCQTAAETMKNQENGGAIINMASVAGLYGFQDSALYCTSKGGVANLTRELAIELGPDGIRVNALNPGVIETAMTTRDVEISGTMEQDIPLQRDGQPEDVANAALFLASDDADYVTGVNLLVDGGMTAEA